MHCTSYRAAMDRRRFLLTSLAGVFPVPMVAAAQPAPRRIGFIGNAQRSAVTDAFGQAFMAGLQEHGWVEFRDVVIERRYAEPRMDAALAAAGELVRAGVEVIVVSSTQTALAAKEVTRTVPIVMTVPADPVAVGLVASLAAGR
jgi:putative ABC transport system substrate-binding protein